MTDYQIKNFEEELNQHLITQAKEIIKDSIERDAHFRKLLKANWKDKRLVGEINDAIHLNKKVIEDLKIEIKDRNSRIIKK